MDQVRKFMADLATLERRSLDELLVSARMEADLRSGLLFHGTHVEFDLGDVRPGGYDGVFWTSDSAAVAQSYIPKAGTTTFLGVPMSYELTQRVRPAHHCMWTTMALEAAGITIDDLDASFDHCGQAMSWRIPPGWPVLGDLVLRLEAMGYRPDGGCYRILMDSDRMMTADWRVPGRLVVVDGHGLRLKDLRQGTESDLMDVEHNDLDRFQEARDAGWDGVVINDFAQTDEGNMGHVSYGLFRETLAVTSMFEVPCVRSTWDEIMNDTSPAFEAWARSMAVEPLPARPPLHIPAP